MDIVLLRYVQVFLVFVAVNTFPSGSAPEDDPEIDLQSCWRQSVANRYRLGPDQLPRSIELELSSDALRQLEERSCRTGRSSAEIALEIISAACPPPSYPAPRPASDL